MSSDHEPIPLLVAYLESSNYGAWAKLPSEDLLLVHFVSDVVLAALNEQDFETLVELLLNDLH